MKKIMIYSLLVIIVVVFFVFLSNPLRKSNEEIRANILALTPIGTSMEDVLKVIENNKKWKILWIKNDYRYETTDLSGDFIIGEKSIRASIGKYINLFKVDVQIYWGFDENSKLIDVGVRKDAAGF